MLPAGNCVLRWCITWRRKLPIKLNWTVWTLLLSCPAHVCKYHINIYCGKFLYAYRRHHTVVKKKTTTSRKRRCQSQEEDQDHLKQKKTTISHPQHWLTWYMSNMCCSLLGIKEGSSAGSYRGGLACNLCMSSSQWTFRVDTMLRHISKADFSSCAK